MSLRSNKRARAEIKSAARAALFVAMVENESRLKNRQHPNFYGLTLWDYCAHVGREGQIGRMLIAVEQIESFVRLTYP